jgi:putative transposase
MRRYRLGSHAKYDLKVHLVWCPKYRKRVLTGPAATRVRDLLRQSSRLLCQEFPHLKKQYWGQHLWATGHFAVTSGTITDELINEYINEQEGEPVHEDDGRFQIDPT